MQQNNFKNNRINIFGQFFFSILTAVMVGVGLSFVSIEGFKTMASQGLPSKAVAIISPTTDEGEGEDPTFISHFSRAFKYSAPNDQTSLTTENTPISALAYSVIDINRNIVVLEKDSDRLMPIASVTKLVTAVIARNLLGDNKSVEVTSNSLATDGNSGFLRNGEKYKVSEILYPLLMVSSNDAAEVLAQSYGRDKFIREMNNWASSIGAYHTYFRDPSGISPNNISTAHDITLIAQWINKNEPDIFDITLTKTKSIRTHTWINPTHFLNLSEYVGGKNGYTPEANRTSLSLFSLGSPKNLYAVVLLGSAERDNDTLSVLNEALK